MKQNDSPNIDTAEAFLHYTIIATLAEKFCQNADIFPNGTTTEDFVVAFEMYFAFILYRDETGQNELHPQIGPAITKEFLSDLKYKYHYTNEQLSEVCDAMVSTISEIMDSLREFVYHRTEEHASALQYFSSTLLRMIPAHKEDPYDILMPSLVFAVELIDILEQTQNIHNSLLEVSNQKQNETQQDTTQQKAEKPMKKNPFFNKYIWVIVLLLLLLSGSIYVNIQQYQTTENFKELAKTYESWFYSEQTKRRNVEDQYDDVLSEYEFFHDYAVVVTENGTKYHHYNCQHVRNSNFFIYNIEYAIGKGYQPCEDCFS